MKDLAETFKSVGVQFTYHSNAVFPQIPYVQDVLCVLQLSNERHPEGGYSEKGVENPVVYMQNLLLVAAVVASKVLLLERHGETGLRKFIGEAIYNLCPPEAKCFLNGAVTEAMAAMVGHRRAPSQDLTVEQKRLQCPCSSCSKLRQDAER